MINKHLAFQLPVPWVDKRFETHHVGTINYLVGPNGSGKSKFAQAIRGHFPNSRLLGTDRLSGMEQTSHLRSIFGDHLAGGLAKGHFSHFKTAGEQGSGIDTIVLLEERLDLRIQVEATLSHLFNRRILLEWDSGNLVPRAILGNSANSYRLDRDECHGIKELLVLLTHLYNDQNSCLIIDEPELNLHPQFQAFLMQEVRKVAGDPAVDPKKKIVFLITHSPFILDFRSIDDVKSVLSFDLRHSVPKQLLNLNAESTARLSGLVPRLNVHHKQLFFSDNPIFVEGILDAQMIGTIQESRGVSVAGAGSCIIDAGGSEEVNRYFELCSAFGKEAHFVYDLDSLFNGSLRSCVREDGTVQDFLASAGVGHDLGAYCGALDTALTDSIDRLLALTVEQIPQALAPLLEFLRQLGARPTWGKSQWAKARIALLTALSRNATPLAAAMSDATVANIQGRLNQITLALQRRHIGLLSGGTLERYLPTYTGNPYEISDEDKKAAVASEAEWLASPRTEAQLLARYGDLFRAVCALPSKVTVNVERVVREYLSRYIHELQVAVTAHPEWGLPQLQQHLAVVQPTAVRIFTLENFMRGVNNEFSSSIAVNEMLGQSRKHVKVTHQTNAGMGGFSLDDAV